jgi:hypothetical protein
LALRFSGFGLQFEFAIPDSQNLRPAQQPNKFRKKRKPAPGASDPETGKEVEFAASALARQRSTLTRQR